MPLSVEFAPPELPHAAESKPRRAAAPAVEKFDFINMVVWCVMQVSFCRPFPGSVAPSCIKGTTRAGTRSMAPFGAAVWTESYEVRLSGPRLLRMTTRAVGADVILEELRLVVPIRAYAAQGSEHADEAPRRVNLPPEKP